MLQQLSALIKDIVIIIVAANFVELLLPRKEFHRYIRMVVGLLIILVLISGVRQFTGLHAFPEPGNFFRDLEGAAAPGSREDLFYDRVLQEYRARVTAEAERVAREHLQGKAAIRAEVTVQDHGDFHVEVVSLRLILTPGTGVTGEGGIDPVVIQVAPRQEAQMALLTPAESRALKEGMARHFHLQEGQVEIFYGN